MKKLLSLVGILSVLSTTPVEAYFKFPSQIVEHINPVFEPLPAPEGWPEWIDYPWTLSDEAVSQALLEEALEAPTAVYPDGWPMWIDRLN